MSYDGQYEREEWQRELDEMGFEQGHAIQHIFAEHGCDMLGNPVQLHAPEEHAPTVRTDEEKARRRELWLQYFADNDEQFGYLDPSECEHYAEILKRRAMAER